jgi:hypothetical protein
MTSNNATRRTRIIDILFLWGFIGGVPFWRLLTPMMWEMITFNSTINCGNFFKINLTEVQGEASSSIPNDC